MSESIFQLKFSLRPNLLDTSDGRELPLLGLAG